MPGSTSSTYDDLYQGGDPVRPPSSSDPDYSATYADDAQSCYEGDLAACDQLFAETPVGSLYEWLGSTCGGRVPEPTYGSCA